VYSAFHPNPRWSHTPPSRCPFRIQGALAPAACVQKHAHTSVSFSSNVQLRPPTTSASSRSISCGGFPSQLPVVAEVYRRLTCWGALRLSSADDTRGVSMILLCRGASLKLWAPYSLGRWYLLQKGAVSNHQLRELIESGRPPTLVLVTSKRATPSRSFPSRPHHFDSIARAATIVSWRRFSTASIRF
jgi:hypothetical protein